MQIVINGLTNGLAIALLACAFQIAYLPTRVFFLGLAAVYTAAPYAARSIMGVGLGWGVAACSAIFVGAAIATALEAGVHSRLAARGASSTVHLVASLGSYVAISHATALVWGSGALMFDLPRMMGGFTAGGGTATLGQLITAAGVSIILMMLALVLMRFRLGVRLRALADNPVAFALYGHRPGPYRLAAFGVAGAVASIVSLMRAYDIGFDPHSGLTALLLAIVAVIVGGRHSFSGPVLGGLVLGVLRAVTSHIGAAHWADPATFLLLGGFLMLRPEGIVSTVRRPEAA